MQFFISVVDWFTSERVSALANTALAIAAVFASAAAIKGLDTWKKQLNWQRDSDLAKKLLFSTYEHRDEIFALRSPRILGIEMLPDNGEIDKENFHVNGMFIAINRRLEKLQSSRSQLDSVLLEVEAQWGPQFKQFFTDIIAEEEKLFYAIRLFLQSLDKNVTKENRTNIMARMKEGGNIHFHSSVEHIDAFASKYIALISKIEEGVRPRLGRSIQ